VENDTQSASVLVGPEVRVGSKGDLTASKYNFRFTSESGPKLDIEPSLFRADFVAEIRMQTARDGWCHF
jgi:hypothetical protein